MLLVVLYFQFSPLLPAPLLYAGPIVLAWLVIGIIVVALLSVRAPGMLALGSKIYVEGEEVQAGAIQSKSMQYGQFFCIACFLLILRDAATSW